MEASTKNAGASQRQSIGDTAAGQLKQRLAWRELESHHQAIQGQHLRTLFAGDPARGTRMTVEAVGIFLDYSKQRISDQTVKLLLELANEVDLRARIDAMFSGEKINITENR